VLCRQPLQSANKIACGRETTQNEYEEDIEPIRRHVKASFALGFTGSLTKQFRSLTTALQNTNYTLEESLAHVISSYFSNPANTRRIC